ncbi:MAG TPA: hypothetical protein VG815_07825 [Chloroflexota bacterium]|nr:hypothetical protein [Chloroflexota bacterium]
MRNAFGRRLPPRWERGSRRQDRYGIGFLAYFDPGTRPTFIPAFYTAGTVIGLFNTPTLAITLMANDPRPEPVVEA